MGSVPEEIGNLVNLEELDLEENGLETIPESIKKCKKLRLLCARDNYLMGVPS